MSASFPARPNMNTEEQAIQVAHRLFTPIRGARYARAEGEGRARQSSVW